MAELHPQEVPFLDRMLTPDEAAKWLGLSVPVLLAKQRKGQIPGVKLGHKTIRFNPRTVLEKASHET